MKGAMEHDSLDDTSASAVSIMEEYHTLANSIRFVLNQEGVVVSPFSYLFQSVVGIYLQVIYHCSALTHSLDSITQWKLILNWFCDENWGW